jgi:hypothetical protein
VLATEDLINANAKKLSEDVGARGFVVAVRAIGVSLSVVRARLVDLGSIAAASRR